MKNERAMDQMIWLRRREFLSIATAVSRIWRRSSALTNSGSWYSTAFAENAAIGFSAQYFWRRHHEKNDLR